MQKSFSKSDWIKIVQDKDLTKELDISIFQTLYSFEGHKAPASQVGLILGYDKKHSSSPLNLEIGRYGKRVIDKYPIKQTIRNNGKKRFWDIFFKGWNEGNLFIWQLKPELKEALEYLNLTGEEKYSEELPKSYIEILQEGIKKRITINAYERNPKVRQICIENWKAICSVCSFDFEKVYGELGKGFIHVHHLVPISEIGKNYQVNPINDLRPVCPNCHAMLHKKNPPFSIDELKSIISKCKPQNS